MRRTINLKNPFYKRRYKEIYKLLFNADLDELSDHSYWYIKEPGYLEKNRPLWIIVESKILNKRIWISQDFGRLGIDTAQLDLNVKTEEYSKSYVWNEFNNQKDMIKYLEKLLEPCLKEYREEQKFDENLKIWKEGIQFAKERIIGFYDKEKSSANDKYITLKTLGEKYSKKLANIMFDFGYGEWVFYDSGTLEKIKEQLIDILEDDKDLYEVLEERNMTKEQLYRNINKNFIEEELSTYLEENSIDVGQIPEEIKEQMINQVRKGMMENYSYKYIIWDSGDLDELIEIIPENCFANENIEKVLNIECEEEEL